MLGKTSRNPVFSVYVVEVLPGGRGWGRRRGGGEGVVGEGVAGGLVGLDWGAGGSLFVRKTARNMPWFRPFDLRL